VAGLDLSMTETGLVHTVSGEACVHSITTREKDGDRRLMQIRREVRELAGTAEFVLIEAPTARSFAAVISGMVHGVVREELHQLGIAYGTILPGALKKFGTGKGTATKTDMAIAALKRGLREFANDNECDAWWLWVAANQHLGQPVLDLPKVQIASLASIRMGK
jgi:Holliday junction resolvasome RuvABC endonuclease subunit